MSKIKVPRPSIVATLAADTAKGEDRTVDVTFYSGATVPRFSWSRGEYMLTMSMDPQHIRMGRLNSGRAPVLESHSDWRTKDVLGVVSKGWIEDGSGKATMRFAKNDPAADQVWNKIEQKILQNVSMGINLHKLKETTKENDKVKSFLAVDWEPFEISVVPIGADPGAHILMSANPEAEQEVEVEQLRASAHKEPIMADETQQTGTEARTDQAVTPPEDQLNAARTVGATAEQARITTILSTCKALGLDIEFANKHIRENSGLDTFRKLAIDQAALNAQKFPPQPVGPGRDHVDMLTDDADKRRRNMTGALLQRFEPGKFAFDEQAREFHYHKDGGQRVYDGARQYASCSLLDIAKECLAVQGIRWQNKSRTEIAQLAFQSTSDFPSILADVAGKSLRAGYEMVESQWRLVAARRTAADFKSQKELTLDANARLELVPQSGEFKRGKLVEGKETYSLSTYGKIIGITRQAVINDDLGAFTRTPQLLGQEVAMLEADTVWGIVTTNGNLADGVALFAAAATRGSDATGNLVTGAGTVISVDNIGVMRKKMMLQKGPGAKTLGVQPRYLVAPATKAQLAEQYTSTNYVAAESSKINPMAGRLTPIIEPRLDAVSTTAWYLFADPNSPNGTVLIYAYLDGQEGPYTETRNGFDTDGVEIKIRHDFAAAAVDFRGACKNDGA